MKYISVKDNLPTGNWSEHEWQKHLSEDVLLYNGLEVLVGRWNRQMYCWETGEPAERNWVDGVTHWVSLPKLPPQK